MEKVKLTKEQVTALEKAINDYGIDTTMNDHSSHNWGGCLSPLNELKTHQMARALYIGYEVEEKFEVADWVVHENRKLIGEVIRIYEDVLKITRLGDSHIWNKKYTRHATPEEIAEEKQRRWWAKHGREVWELRVGDALINIKNTQSNRIQIVEGIDENAVLLTLIRNDVFVGKYDLNILREEFEVFCFAEDRKDMEGENE